MGKISIHSLANINSFDVSQAQSLLGTFCDKSLAEKCSTKELVREFIVQCPSVVAKSIDTKVEIYELWFCFDANNTFICFHDELNFTLHSICLPHSLKLPTGPEPHLSLVDKFKILAQLNMMDCHNMVQLPYSFLCVEQLLSAASMFSVNLTKTQVQTCCNINNALCAKIRQSSHYKNTYGTSHQLSEICFDFAFDNLFDCIGHGKATEDTRENEFGALLVPTHLKPTNKGGSNRKTSRPNPTAFDNSNINKLNLQIGKHNSGNTSTTSVSINSEGGRYKSGTTLNQSVTHQTKKEKKPIITSVVPLATAPLEQLRGITAFYGIQCNVNRRVKPHSITEIIRSCDKYQKNLESSPISSDVLFCFNNNNEVVCIFQDISKEKHALSLPKTFSSRYTTASTPSLNFGEKQKILLQRAIASLCGGKIIVPWLALTITQQISITTEICGNQPAVLVSEPLSTHAGENVEYIEETLLKFINESLNIKGNKHGVQQLSATFPKLQSTIEAPLEMKFNEEDNTEVVFNTTPLHDLNKEKELSKSSSSYYVGNKGQSHIVSANLLRFLNQEELINICMHLDVDHRDLRTTTELMNVILSLNIQENQNNSSPCKKVDLDSICCFDTHRKFLHFIHPEISSVHVMLPQSLKEFQSFSDLDKIKLLTQTSNFMNSDYATLLWPQLSSTQKVSALNKLGLSSTAMDGLEDESYIIAHSNLSFVFASTNPMMCLKATTVHPENHTSTPKLLTQEVLAPAVLTPEVLTNDTSTERDKVRSPDHINITNETTSQESSEMPNQEILLNPCSSLSLAPGEVQDLDGKTNHDSTARILNGVCNTKDDNVLNQSHSSFDTAQLTSINSAKHFKQIEREEKFKTNSESTHQNECQRISSHRADVAAVEPNTSNSTIQSEIDTSFRHGKMLSIEVDDEFSLNAKFGTSPYNQLIDPGTMMCHKCQQSCDSETLCCGICSLQVHYSCYSSVKCDDGSYKCMSAEVYSTLLEVKNMTWLCNDCDSPSIVNKILDLASVKVKERVSQSIKKIKKDMTLIEKELATDSLTEKNNSEPSNTSELCSTSSTETSNSRDQINQSVQFDESTPELLPLYRSQSLDSISVLNSTPLAPSYGRRQIQKTCISNFKIKDATPFASTSTMHQLGNGLNTAEAKDGSNSCLNEENQNKFICRGICQLCNTDCDESEAETLSCYICNLNVHFPCPKSKLGLYSQNCSESDIGSFLSEKNDFKWFCGICKTLSFSKAVLHKSKDLSHEVTKISLTDTDSIRESINTSSNTKYQEATPAKTAIHFPSFQSQLTQHVKEAVKAEMNDLKNYLSENLCFKEDTNQERQEQSGGHTSSSSPSYARKVSQNSSPSERIVSSLNSKKNQIQNSNEKVNPLLSVIIKNVQSPKFKISSNCKSQFNKHFKYMRIKSIFSTQAGNIIVELFEQQDLDRVLKEWKGTFFCTTSPNEVSTAQELTTVTLMKNSEVKSEIIIKGVNKHWSEEEIDEQLVSSHNAFSEPTTKRFIKRNGEVLNTIKVSFRCRDEYLKAMQLGVFLYGEHFNVEPFKVQPRAHQCFKCKHFGHPAKWCTRKLKCEYCASEGHSGKDCIIRGEIHEYNCVNCHGNHSATYYRCPEYIKHLRSPATTNINYDE